MRFSTKLVGGTLLKRHRRFLVDVRLDNGAIVTAHCPNSGTMVGCSEHGRRVMLSENKDPHRRNAYTWEMIQINKSWVGVNTLLPRKIVTHAIQEKRIPCLSNYCELLLDAEYGREKKIDIMMHGLEQNIFVHIHHVAWAENRIAKFPETPNARACQTLRDLTEIAEQGHRAVAFFFIQRGDCDVFSPAVDVDAEFGKIHKKALKRGVEIIAYRGIISPEEISLGVAIPCGVD